MSINRLFRNGALDVHVESIQYLIIPNQTDENEQRNTVHYIEWPAFGWFEIGLEV